MSATHVVTITADENDGNFSANDLSLREAIAKAATGDTITFASSLAGKAITLTLGELALGKDLTINGDVNGDYKADVTISANNASRIFNVTGATTDVSLKSLTLADGRSSGEGGAIRASGFGTLSITDTTIRDSSSDSDGGALSAQSGTVKIANTLISGNEAGDAGGGAAFAGANVAIANTTIYGNMADGNGGGIDMLGPGSLTVVNSDIFFNIADFDGNTSTAGGGIFIEAAPDSAVTIANSLFDNFSGFIPEAGIWVDVSDVVGTIDSLSHSAFMSSYTATTDDGGFVTSESSLALDFLLADNGGTVKTLARGLLSVLLDGGDNAALPLDVNDVDHDGNTSELLPRDADGGKRIRTGTVDIGAVEKVSLYDALDELPLADSKGNPISSDSLFDGGRETVVFVLPQVTYLDGTTDMFAAAEVTQANGLIAAAKAADHALDVVVISLDDGTAPPPGLDAKVTFLRLAKPSSAASQAAVDEFYRSIAPHYTLSPEFEASIAKSAFHRPAGKAVVDLVTSIVSTTTPLGLAGQFQQKILDTDLETAINATGNPINLKPSLVPQLTTAKGAYNAVGEVIPDLGFRDQDGDAVSLHDLGDGLVVLSICATWCLPCTEYSKNLETLSHAVSPAIDFAEILAEDQSGGLSEVKDAALWADRWGLSVPVLTADDNIPLLENFGRGIGITGFPDYIVIDGATGKIVARFQGYDEDTAGNLDAIAEGYFKPAFSSGKTAKIAENTEVATVVYDADATDADDKPGDPGLTYSLAGTDALRFAIDPATGKVKFAAVPDFESPADGNHDNAYDVIVKASDGVNTTSFAVTIKVTDAAEGVATTGDDTISGTGADEKFRGDLGNDTLTGKGGKDAFRFDTGLDKSTNVDHITDFAPGSDLIKLDRSVFRKLKTGDLDPKAFTSGKVKADDRIVYDKKSGDLSFDIDGKGGVKSVKFAVLDGDPDGLDAQNFVVLA